MATNYEKLNNFPLDHSILQGAPDELLKDLKFLTDIFQRIEKETAEIAETLFEHLINATDEQIMTGTVAPSTNPRTNSYIKILNRLFLLSRSGYRGGIRVLSRQMVQELDKKTYALSVCNDGGTSLEVLCDVANEENRARTPTTSPVKVTVRQLVVSRGHER